MSIVILFLTVGLAGVVALVATLHVTAMMATGISRYPELGRGAGWQLLAVLAGGGLAVTVLTAGGPPGNLLQVAVWVMLPVIGLAIFGLAGRWILYRHPVNAEVCMMGRGGDNPPGGVVECDKLTLPPRGAR